MESDWRSTRLVGFSPIEADDAPSKMANRPICFPPEFAKPILESVLKFSSGD